jgi:malonyl CoA-acyl carrier protein transacylase
LSYKKRIKDGGKEPDFLAGHSLGEYNALQAAGVITFEDGLKLVKRRGELMSQARNGGMAAILNCTEKQTREILKDANLTTIDIANLNSPSQIVISGLIDDVNKAQPYFEKADAMFIPLNTSGAFHSRYMKQTQNEFEKIVREITFSKPNIQVIANVTARPYVLEEVAENLIQQLSNCVRWNESIMYLLSQGDMEFEELGVGDVLTKLFVWIRKAFNPDMEPGSGQPHPKSELGGERNAVVSSSDSKVETPVKSDHSGSEKKKPGLEQIKEKLDPAILVDQWNRVHPIGTKVTSDFYDTQLETRTEAMLLFGHRAAVYMQGYNGYFDLREVRPVQ